VIESAGMATKGKALTLVAGLARVPDQHEAGRCWCRPPARETFR
jgi:hypothetical protein